MDMGYPSEQVKAMQGVEQGSGRARVDGMGRRWGRKVSGLGLEGEHIWQHWYPLNPKSLSGPDQSEWIN